MDAAAEAEFSEFMQGRWAQLVRLGYGLTGDRGLAEDVAQTALIRAYAAWPRVSRAGNPDAYVRRIMVNANISRLRKRRVREQLTGVPPEPTAATAATAAAAPHPADDRQVLTAALMTLPYGQRAIGVLPGLLNQRPRPAPVSPRPKLLTVTVHRPGPGAPRGEIAWGTANGKAWQVSVTRSGTFVASGMTAIGGPANWSSGSAPVVLDGAGEPAGEVLAGPVRPDVTSVSLTFSTGAVGKLRPVRVFGHRMVAITIPRRLLVTRVTVYSRHRELAYAIPFNGMGTPSWHTWLHPGQPVPPAETATLFTGRVQGDIHTVSVHLGPWGRALVDATRSGSTGSTGPAAPGGAGGAIMSNGPGRPGLVVGALRPSVSRLALTLSGGGSENVPLIQVGALKYYAFVVTAHPRVVSWAAFDAAGSRISGAPGAPG